MSLPSGPSVRLAPVDEGHAHSLAEELAQRDFGAVSAKAGDRTDGRVGAGEQIADLL